MTCIHNCNCLSNKLIEISRLQAEVDNLRAKLNVQISTNSINLETTKKELSESQNKMSNLINLLTELKQDDDKKNIELKRKDDEIEALKRDLEIFQERYQAQQEVPPR